VEGHSTKQTSSRKFRSIVLHGKVQHVYSNESESSEDNTSWHQQQQVSRRQGPRQYESVREGMQRKSTFAKLTQETKHFQKMVADLEKIINDSGESPETAWRARILIRSAEETDRDLWKKLYEYERTLLVSGDKTSGKENGSRSELRTAQTACLKLHRDFKRSHKALVMALSLYEKRQKAEVSRLGAVGWSQVEPSKSGEDFFDRAMREREAELDRMNNSMHKVNDIYNELAALVEGQQEQIDQLDDNVVDSKANVESAANQFNCMANRDNLCGAAEVDVPPCGCGTLTCMENLNLTRSTSTDSPRDVQDTSVHDGETVNTRVSEEFHWYMPFETLSEDMKAVHNDITDLGKGILSKGKHLECNVPN